jgi:DNA-binding NarL/FixJ family response regulator
MRVLVFCRQSLFRQGLERSFSLADDIEILNAAEIDNEMLSNLENLPPDVAVVDVDAPEADGLGITRRLKQRLPNIGIIVLTSNYSDVAIFEAMKAQASACLSKEITAEKLVEVVKAVGRGEHPINESLVTHPILADQVLRQFQEFSRQSETQPFISPLTPREMEILDYIARGLLNKQIATQLGISEQTIKNHVTSILRKLNANARTEAVIVALKRGLISIH